MKLSICIFTLALTIMGCGRALSPEEEIQTEIIHELGPYLRCLRGHPIIFSIEPLDGGYGAIVKGVAAKESSEVVPSQYAYWVGEREVYSVNRADVACSPDLPVAPKEITYESVCKATGEAP